MDGKIFLLTSGLCFSLCGVTSAKPIRDDAQQASPAGGEFRAKVVAIVTKAGYDGAVLEEPRVRHLGNKAFVVGKRLTLNPSRWSGTTTWIAVDEIATVYEFNSIAEAREAHAESQRANPPPGPGIVPQGPVAPFPTVPPPGPNAVAPPPPPALAPGQ